MGRVSEGGGEFVINGKSVLAVIPARGGSKRLSRKNILPLSGKPLVVWTIEAGLKSKFVDEVVVSSDDEEILNISVKANARAMIRPKELSTDFATSLSVVNHVLDEMENNYDIIVLLQPTSPLRTNIDVDSALELLSKNKADGIISVCETDHNPLFANTLPVDGSMKNFIQNNLKNTRTQDLPKYYRINGAIYIYKTRQLIDENTFFLKDNIFAYIMNKNESVDIDDSFDYKFAEFLIENQTHNES